MADQSSSSSQVDQSVPADERHQKPVRFADLLNLFSRPRVFFSSDLNLGATRLLLLVIWIVGISSQIGRLDAEIVRQDLGSGSRAWVIMEPVVNGSWLVFWLWCMGIGVISGALVYWVGGWWYRMRLYMSGAAKDIERTLPRYIYIYASLVVALPSVLVVMVFTPFFPNYISAYNSDELVTAFLPVFVFWSVAVSYIGATESFNLKVWPARVWFLILPIIFYLAFLGLVVWLLAFFSEGFS